MFFTALLFVHIVLCLGLIGFVLLQQGKGADAGATFGGSNAGSVLGTGGADFATKLTTGMAFAFMITSVLLVRAYQTAEVEQLPIATAPGIEGSAIGNVLEQEAAPVVEKNSAIVEKSKTSADASDPAAPVSIVTEDGKENTSGNAEGTMSSTGEKAKP